jgi:hypothetical protein
MSRSPIINFQLFEVFSRKEMAIDAEEPAKGFERPSRSLRPTDFRLESITSLLIRLSTGINRLYTWPPHSK